jgi:ABC-type Na+ efflux pump permease subunit
MPLVILASLFFVVIPGFVLLIITNVSDVELSSKLSDAVGALPSAIQEQLRGESGPVQAAYALAVFLFAPLAIVVPLTVSSAVGANTIIGERERGSGEFLAHSPASERDIFLGKLVSALIPGYLTALVGFGLYSLIVNLLVGPKVGGWFFPTTSWVLLLLWVLPPFICLAVAIILGISARVTSAAAAQQSSALVTLPLILIAYSVASGSMLEGDTLALSLGAVAWVVAILALARGSKAVSRERLLGLGG